MLLQISLKFTAVLHAQAGWLCLLHPRWEGAMFPQTPLKMNVSLDTSGWRMPL
jgi:hypothetical protein